MGQPFALELLLRYTHNMKYEILTGTPENLARSLNARPQSTVETFNLLDDGHFAVAIVGNDPDVHAEFPRSYFVKSVPVSGVAGLDQSAAKASRYTLDRKGLSYMMFAEDWEEEYTEAEGTTASEAFTISIAYTAVDRTVTITDAEFPEFPVYILNDEGGHDKFDDLDDILDNFSFVVGENQYNVNLQFNSKNFIGYASHGFDLENDYTGDGGVLNYTPTYYRDVETNEAYTPNYDYYTHPHTTVVITGGLRSVAKQIAALPDIKGCYFVIELARERPSFFVITVNVPVV